jgi:hypothetical protein
MPTVDSVRDFTSHETYPSDVDLLEMFLNFPLDPKVQKHAGVDLTPYLPPKTASEGGKGIINWKRWNGTLMGLVCSPWIIIKCMIRAEDIVCGDPSDMFNTFHFNRVRMNLPGDPSYDPTLPWLSKVCVDSDGVTRLILISRPIVTTYDLADFRRTSAGRQQSASLSC